MEIIIPSDDKQDNYPDNWNFFSTNAQYLSPGTYGFPCKISEVNRFAARFRAAKSFRGVILDGYAQSTTSGYSSLCRVVFTWSAFESFLRLLGVSQRDSDNLIQKHGANETLKTIRRIDTDSRFFDFISEKVDNKTHKEQLSKYKDGSDFNLTYLASSIRHIFAHGYLTPNVNSVQPEKCVSICDCLCEFLISVMNNEFRNRVADFIEEMDSGLSHNRAQFKALSDSPPAHSDPL